MVFRATPPASHHDRVYENIAFWAEGPQDEGGRDQAAVDDGGKISHQRYQLIAMFPSFWRLRSRESPRQSHYPGTQDPLPGRAAVHLDAVATGLRVSCAQRDLNSHDLYVTYDQEAMNPVHRIAQGVQQRLHRTGGHAYMRSANNSASEFCLRLYRDINRPMADSGGDQIRPADGESA